MCFNKFDFPDPKVREVELSYYFDKGCTDLPRIIYYRLLLPSRLA